MKETALQRQFRRVADSAKVCRKLQKSSDSCVKQAEENLDAQIIILNALLDREQLKMGL